MPPATAATTFLAQLAPWAENGWRSLGARVFPGDLRIATSNSVYGFRDGVFVSRAKKPARSFEAPTAMQGTRLVGFLLPADGLWSLSAVWTPGAHAVLWTPGGLDAGSFILTSMTASFTLAEPEPKPQPGPKPEPWLDRRIPPQSGVMLREIARPPSFSAPRPPSMTRLHPAPSAPATP